MNPPKTKGIVTFYSQDNTWGTEFVAKNTSIYSYSEQYTEKDMLKKAYDSDIVLTLDELPDLKEYPIK